MFLLKVISFFDCLLSFLCVITNLFLFKSSNKLSDSSQHKHTDMWPVHSGLPKRLPSGVPLLFCSAPDWSSPAIQLQMWHFPLPSWLEFPFPLLWFSVLLDPWSFSYIVYTLVLVECFLQKLPKKYIEDNFLRPWMYKKIVVLFTHLTDSLTVN